MPNCDTCKIDFWHLMPNSQNDFQNSQDFNLKENLWNIMKRKNTSMKLTTPDHLKEMSKNSSTQ